MNKYKYEFSVFTATFNRGILLPKVYECLKQQTYNDFEWVIIDDGSTDDTETICERFIEENIFPIKYKRHDKNMGKHQAWRTAMKLMEGQYEIGADDDDTFPPETLEIFKRNWDELEQRADYDLFWEIRGRVSVNGNLFGKRLPYPPPFDSDYNEINYKYRFGTTEMQGCRRTEILRKEAAVPEHFLLDEFCTNFQEGIRWSRAARKYKTRFIEDIVRHYNRTDAGLASAKVGKGRRSQSKTYNFLVSEIYVQNEQRDLMLKYALKRYLKNILLIAYHSVALKRNAVKYIDKGIDKTLLIICYPLASFLYLVKK